MTNNCTRCGQKIGFFDDGGDGLCSVCLAKRAHETAIEGIASNEAEKREREVAAFNAEQERQTAIAGIVVTTETWTGEVERLGIVATEVVLGMNIFKDMLTNVRDVFGGRSGAVQNTLEDARTAALEDLRAKAVELGADAVIAVDIDYHSISTGSAVNMMMVAVSGTAVKFKPDA